jgi:hypothetical protein
VKDAHMSYTTLLVDVDVHSLVIIPSSSPGGRGSDHGGIRERMCKVDMRSTTQAGGRLDERPK